MRTIFSNKRIIQKCVGMFLMLCIGVGLISHIVPYVFNRSLWIDEAMLANSICTRPLSQLVSSGLDWGQSSPVGWLFIVKLITMIFGISETALRMWSLITAFGCIALVYLLLSGKVENNYALLITAIFSLTDRYIYYSNELKPYMSDNFCCLMTLFVWQKYKEKKFSLLFVVIVFSVLIWFSFSAVFFVAACMVIECFGAINEHIRDTDNRIFKRLGLCAVVLVSFILNYVFWLSKTSNNAGGTDYWAHLRFPLPISLSNIVLILKMAHQFWAFYDIYIAALFIFLFLLYIIICINKKKDKSQLLVPFLISLLLLFTASFCGFYPIQDRLVQVYAIVAIIMAGYACGEIEIFHGALGEVREIAWAKIFFYGILAGCLAIVGMGGCKNLFARHVYKSGSEVAESIKYLENNATDNDVIYVFCNSIPVYIYENEYQVSFSDLNSMPGSRNKQAPGWPELPIQLDNTIYGQSLFTFYYQVPYSYEGEDNERAIAEDAQLILENDSVYLFTSHRERGISGLIEVLEEYGTVDVVVDSYDTHLYHFNRRDT